MAELKVTVGGQDVSASVHGLTLRRAINDQPSVDFFVDMADLSDLVLDYTALVIVARIGEMPAGDSDATWRPLERPGQGEQLLFGGRIAHATVDAEVVHVVCKGGFLGLQDSLVGILEGELDPHEHVLLLTHIAGIPRESVNIEGLAAKERRTFQVVAPIDGVSCKQTRTVAGVTFMPPAGISNLGFNPRRNATVDSEFSSAHSLAFVEADAQVGLDAETAALTRIDLCLEWITAQACDGRARVNGMLTEFDRMSTLARPRRRDIVAVRPSDGGGYVRSPGERSRSTIVDLDESAIGSTLPDQPPRAQLEALSALARAQSARDTTACILSLWEAIEFTAGDVQVPDMFRPAQTRALRRALKKGQTLTVEQRRRLDETLANLNQAPLFRKVRQFASVTQTPMTEDEFTLLHRLRSYRNDALHGRVPRPIPPEDLRQGISVVSRLVLAAICRLDVSTAAEDGALAPPAGHAPAEPAP